MTLAKRLYKFDVWHKPTGRRLCKVYGIDVEDAKQYVDKVTPFTRKDILVCLADQQED